MLDWLKPILGDAYTEEIDSKIAAEIGKGFVARADFNEVGTAKKKPEQDVATFMVSINLGGNIVPCSEKNTWNPELYSFVELEEPLVLESAWLSSSDNPNPALARFVKMVEGARD